MFGFKKKRFNKFKRIFLIVLDSVGAGAAPDSEKFGDIGVHTLKHVIEGNDYKYENLEKLGLFNIVNDTDNKTVGYYTRAH